MSRPTVNSLETLSGIVSPKSRLLCLFSGGLDSTYLLFHLSELKCSGVIALTVDLGGGLDGNAVEQACRRFGARPLIVDKQEEFARDFVAPSIAAHASYLGGHPVSASLSRPLMAKTAVEVARELNCDAILHTSNRSQNSLRRFNNSIGSLGFERDFGSPFESDSTTRKLKSDALRAAGLLTFDGKSHSGDSNFWGREFEYGELDDPERIVVPEFLYRWTASSPAEGVRELSVEFHEGVPVRLNGDDAEFIPLVNQLNTVAGSYGLGRYVGLEEIAGGFKVQEVREMPAAHVLFDAYRRLESGCLSAECIREKMHMEQVWVREAVEGRWYEPLRNAAQAFIHSAAQRVTGAVSYELGWRHLQVTSLKAEAPLYLRDRLPYETSS